MSIEKLGKLSLEQKLASVKKDKILQKLVEKYINEQPEEHQHENIKMNIQEEEPKGKGRPKKYATEEERKAKKREQTLASNKKKREERKAQMEGEGVLDGIKSVAKAIGSTAKKGVKAVQKVAESAQKFATAVVEGRDDYPPKVRQILAKNGDAVITKWTVKRAPVPSVLTSALSGLSWGQFGKNQKDAGFDTLFHLFIELESVNGRRFLVEKNEVINMEIDLAERSNTESRIIPNPPQGLTLAQIMDATKERQGGKYFKYSARDNNCQDFILALLQANGASDAETVAFVKQDTKKLYDNLSGLRKISNTLTDLGGRANVLMSGVGMKKPEGEGDLIHIDIGSHNEKKISGKAIGMGKSKKLFDQKFSLNEAKHFIKKDILGKKDEQKPKTNGVLDQQFSINEAVDAGKKLFGKGFEGSDSERDIHRKFMGSGVQIHHHHHYHLGKGKHSDSDSESDEEMHGGKLKMSKASKTIVKGLKTAAHYAIPAATSALGAMAAEALAPELGPVSGVAGAAAGSYAGNQINKKLGIGFGLSAGLMGDGVKGRPAKGSAEAKAWGAKMKAARDAKK